MELKTINKLYLELSQISTAKTKRELELEFGIGEIRSCAVKLSKKMDGFMSHKKICDITLIIKEINDLSNDLLP